MVRSCLLAVLVACSSSPAGSDVDAGLPDAPIANVDAPPPDAKSCGLRSGTRGLSQRETTIDGQRRTYLVYLPEGVDSTTPIPFVTVFHGYTMSGQAMVDTAHFTELADSEHIAVVFPDGQGGPNSSGAPWNVGSGVCTSYFGIPPNAPGDDFAFMDAMLADVTDDQCIDDDHRYATGFSMGGYFSHQAGCMRPDIRAIAPHSGGTHDLAACTSDKKPVIIFHGSSDPLVPAYCSDPDAPPVIGGKPSADLWAEHNGCGTTTQRIEIQGGHCELYDGCPDGGQVELCVFDAMGHCWAGGSLGTYGCPTYESATQLEWAFFKQYAW